MSRSGSPRTAGSRSSFQSDISVVAEKASSPELVDHRRSESFALQEVNPVEGQNAFVKISAKETTRLYIDGGKIRSLIATDGELTVEKDEDRGQLFIRPAILNKPINVRVIAGSGAT